MLHRSLNRRLAHFVGFKIIMSHGIWDNSNSGSSRRVDHNPRPHKHKMMFLIDSFVDHHWFNTHSCRAINYTGTSYYYSLLLVASCSSSLVTLHLVRRSLMINPIHTTVVQVRMQSIDDDDDDNNNVVWYLFECPNWCLGDLSCHSLCPFLDSFLRGPRLQTLCVGSCVS